MPYTTCFKMSWPSNARPAMYVKQNVEPGQKEKMVHYTNLKDVKNVLDLGDYRTAYADIKMDGIYVEFWRRGDRIYFCTGKGKLMKLFLPVAYLPSMKTGVRMRGELCLMHTDCVGEEAPVDRDNWETFIATNAFFKTHIFHDGTALNTGSPTDTRFTSFVDLEEWSTVRKPDGGTVNIRIYVHNLVEHKASLNEEVIKNQLYLASPNFVPPNWVKVENSDHACDMFREAIAGAHEGIVFFLIISGAGNDSDQADESENQAVWIKMKERIPYTGKVVLEGLKVKGRREYTVQISDEPLWEVHVRLGNCRWAEKMKVYVDVIPKSLKNRGCRFGIGMGVCPTKQLDDTPASAAATAIYVGTGGAGQMAEASRKRPAEGAPAMKTWVDKKPKEWDTLTVDVQNALKSTVNEGFLTGYASWDEWTDNYCKGNNALRVILWKRLSDAKAKKDAAKVLPAIVVID